MTSQGSGRHPTAPLNAHRPGGAQARRVPRRARRRRRSGYTPDCLHTRNARSAPGHKGQNPKQTIDVAVMIDQLIVHHTQLCLFKHWYIIYPIFIQNHWSHMFKKHISNFLRSLASRKHINLPKITRITIINKPPATVFNLAPFIQPYGKWHGEA